MMLPVDLENRLTLNKKRLSTYGLQEEEIEGILESRLGARIRELQIKPKDERIRMLWTWVRSERGPKAKEKARMARMLKARVPRARPRGEVRFSKPDVTIAASLAIWPETAGARLAQKARIPPRAKARVVRRD